MTQWLSQISNMDQRDGEGGSSRDSWRFRESFGGKKKGLEGAGR